MYAINHRILGLCFFLATVSICNSWWYSAFNQTVQKRLFVHHVQATCGFCINKSIDDSLTVGVVHTHKPVLRLPTCFSAFVATNVINRKLASVPIQDGYLLRRFIVKHSFFVDTATKTPELVNDGKCIPKLTYSKLYCFISTQSSCYVFQPATRDLLYKIQYLRLRSIFFTREKFLRIDEQTAKWRCIR